MKSKQKDALVKNELPYTKNNKNYVVRTRITNAEKKELLQKVQELGITTSDFMRLAIKSITPLSKNLKTYFFENIDGKLSYLGNLANNLNQITRILHILNKSSEIDNDSIIETRKLLDKIHPAIKDLNNIINEFLNEIKSR